MLRPILSLISTFWLLIIIALAIRFWVLTLLIAMIVVPLVMLVRRIARSLDAT